MRNIVALTHIVYGGKFIDAGEEFSATDNEAEGFVLTGKATYTGDPNNKKTAPPIPAPPAVSQAPYSAPEGSESKPVEPMTSDSGLTGQRRTYRRRDMKPQE